MWQKPSPSRKSDLEKKETPKQLARRVAWQLFWKEFGALRVRRAAKLLVILITSYLGAPGAMIVRKISGPSAGSTIPSATPKGSLVSRRSTRRVKRRSR